MLRNPAYFMLSAAALVALGGCTITVRTKDSDPPPQPAAAAQSQPAATSKTARRPFRPTKLGTTTKPGTTGTDAAPRITSTIAFGNGTGGAFKGQAYVIPDTTTKMPDFGSMIPFATLFTDSFNVQPQDFSGGFTGALVQEDWFANRNERNLTIPSEGKSNFKLT